MSAPSWGPGPAYGGLRTHRRPTTGRCDRSGRRPMARPDKTADVAELVEAFPESAGAVLTEYRGLTVKQLQDLRRSVGEHGTYAVVKSTLAKIAGTDAGADGVDGLLVGRT